MRQIFNGVFYKFCNASIILKQSEVKEKLFKLNKGQIQNLQQYLKNPQHQNQQSEIQLHKELLNSIDQKWRISLLKDIAFFYLNNGLQDHRLMKKIFDHLNKKLDGQFERITEDQYSQIIRIACRLYPSSVVKIQDELIQAIQMCIKQLMPNYQNFNLFTINNIIGGLVLLNNTQHYDALHEQINTINFNEQQLTHIFEYLHTVIKTNDRRFIEQGQQVFLNQKPAILKHKYSDSDLQRLLNVILSYNITDQEIISIIVNAKFNITETTLYFFLQIMQRKSQVLPYMVILKKFIPVCDQFIKQNKNVQLFYKMYYYPFNLDFNERKIYLQNYQQQKEHLQQYYNTFDPQKQMAFLLTLLTNEPVDKLDSTLNQLENLKDKIDDRFLIDTLYKIATHYLTTPLVEHLVNQIIQKNIYPNNVEQIQQIRTVIDYLGQKYPKVKKIWRPEYDQRLENLILSQLKENQTRMDLVQYQQSRYELGDELKTFSFEQYLIEHCVKISKRIYKESRVGFYFIDYRITNGKSQIIEYDDPNIDNLNKNDIFIELNGLNHFQNNQEIHHVQKMRQEIFKNFGINLKSFSVPQYAGKLLYLERLFTDL